MLLQMFVLLQIFLLLLGSLGSQAFLSYITVLAVADFLTDGIPTLMVFLNIAAVNGGNGILAVV